MGKSSYTPPVGRQFKFINDLYLTGYESDVAEIVSFEVFQVGRSDYRSVKDFGIAFRDGTELFDTFFWSSPQRIERESDRPALAVINQCFYDLFFYSVICEKHFIEKR